MDTGTQIDQIDAASRLLSAAYATDDVVLQRSVIEDGRSRRYALAISITRRGQTLPRSEIAGSVDVARVGYEWPEPSYAVLVHALHTEAMRQVSAVAEAAAALAAAGRAAP